MSARRRFRPCLISATALAVALALPAVSRADCGGTETSGPATHLRGKVPPLAIGDSTMPLSLPGLAARGYAANARGCRQADRLARIRRPELGTHQTAPLSGPPLALSATLASVGYVDATVTGMPGASVQLSEQLASGTTSVGAVQLSPSGTATLARALTWRCDQRVRTLVAATLAPAAPDTVTTTVMTPSCSKRLAAAVDGRVRVGRAIAIRLLDRWRIGGLPLTICVTPPGGRHRCASWPLRPGQARRVISVSAPRPGGWQVSVQTRYGFKKVTVVWASHVGGRIRLLAAGDSEMQILDDLIRQDLAPSGVDVTSDARISTGLTNPFFFNWLDHAARQAPILRPDVTVVFMGANEGFSVAGRHGQPVACCGAAWSAGYANLVATMMRIYLRGTAGRVYWFLLPAPRPAKFALLFDAINAGIRAAAKRFPGRVSLIDANAFFTPGNRYRDYMVYHGHGFVIHEPDGIHLSTASDAIDATIVAHRLLADRVTR